MAGTCKVCGGLIPASNEVLGYAGPMCSGNHGSQPIQIIFTPPKTVKVEPPKDEVRDKIAQLYYDTYDLVEVAGKSMPPKFETKVRRLIKLQQSALLDRVEAELPDNYEQEITRTQDGDLMCDTCGSDVFGGICACHTINDNLNQVRTTLKTLREEL